ncbi:MAG: formate dehydrogenase subunit gamma [Candidatus Competibacterales bacterium]|nr:formate dehydrogenase subunit gamma [Candidatus Competibacterales bacterium]
MARTSVQRTRRRRALWGLLAALLVLVAAAPLSGLLLTDPALAQEAAAQDNERANFWRAVRDGVGGYSAVQGPEAGVLIQNGGENWRMLREGPVTSYGAYILIGALVLIVLVFLLFGRARLRGGREYMTVERWSLFDRTLHWFTAITFLILAITGLSLLFGREVLIPYIGKDAFAAYAGFAKDVHNYLGPFFSVALVIELLKWLPHNIPRGVDLIWFLKGGGIVGRGHPSAGRMNGGEKLWYWLLFVVGLLLVASGLVLDFPIFGQTRSDMQLAQLIHVAAAIVLIAVALGHIYIGTLGTEGALEGMVTGRVDTRWAKQHHDLWYEELLAKGVKPVKSPEPGTSDRSTGSVVPPRTSAT